MDEFQKTVEVISSLVSQGLRIPDTNLVVELVDGESDAEDDDGDEGHGHAAVPDLDGEVGQLGLQYALLLVVLAPAPARALRGVACRVGQRVVGMGITHPLLHVNWKEKKLDECECSERIFSIHDHNHAPCTILVPTSSIR